MKLLALLLIALLSLSALTSCGTTRTDSRERATKIATIFKGADPEKLFVISKDAFALVGIPIAIANKRVLPGDWVRSRKSSYAAYGPISRSARMSEFKEDHDMMITMTFKEDYQVSTIKIAWSVIASNKADARAAFDYVKDSLGSSGRAR